MKSSLQGIWPEKSLDLYKIHTVSNSVFHLISALKLLCFIPSSILASRLSISDQNTCQCSFFKVPHSWLNLYD